jgi:hypothetical protein
VAIGEKLKKVKPHISVALSSIFIYLPPSYVLFEIKNPCNRSLMLPSSLMDQYNVPRSLILFFFKLRIKPIPIIVVENKEREKREIESK